MLHAILTAFMRSTYSHNVRISPHITFTSPTKLIRGPSGLLLYFGRSLAQQPHHRRIHLSVAASAARPGAGSPPSLSYGEDELPFNDYTPASNSAYWETRPVAVTKRTLKVGATLSGWFLTGRFHPSRSKEQRADELRNILTNLGPAYVKIGQAISSRPDVVPPEFLQELEKLQDRLPSFPTTQALEVIAAEFGRPASDVFSYISPEPVAAASLGQVYKATLRRDGSQVAVKVQRPGVATSIALDIYVLRYLARGVRKWGKLNSDLPALLDEWAASLFRELDYRTEAANGTRFAQLYGKLEGVYVPAMMEDLTTRRVLVMEWIDGDRLRSAAEGATGSSEDDLRLVEVGVRCSLEQMLEEGFYHADPHPGNLLRTRDGKLAYLDFGMMGQVDESIRRGLLRATLHLVNREYDALADDFVTLGMLPQDSDKADIVPALTGVFSEALKNGVNNLSFGDLSGKLGRTMYQYKFQIPSYYTLLVRSLSVLEGIALASNPSYKVLGSAYPWIARRLLTDTTPELRSTLTALLYKEGKFNFKRMESLLVQASRSPTSGFANEKQRSTNSDAVALLLSSEATFVRGVVVEELAKGADAAWRLTADAAREGSLDQLKQALGTVQSVPFLLQPPAGGTLLTALIDVLTVLPRLADQDDAAQVEGLRSLVVALQGAAAASGGPNTMKGVGEEGKAAGGAAPRERPELSDLYGTLERAVALLQFLLKEMETLTPEQRSEAFRLPIEVAQATSSRAVARLIRWFAVGEAEAAAAAAASAAETTGGAPTGKAAATAAERASKRATASGSRSAGSKSI